MVILKKDFDLRRELDPKHMGDPDEVNTTEVNTLRFWLMLKLKSNWTKRWEIYMAQLRTRISNNLISVANGSDSASERKQKIDEIVQKLEVKAWATMPTDFQKRMGVDRVLRH